MDNKLKELDGYISMPLKAMEGSPIGTAKYKEPVYSKGVLQDHTIDTTVELWPLKIVDPSTHQTMHATRFGSMSLIRFIPIKELYDITYTNK